MKKLIIFVGILIIINLVFYFISFLGRKNNPIPRPTPTPIEILQKPGRQSPGEAISNDFGNQVQPPSDSKSEALGKLIGKLPYSSRLFSLSYDYVANGFSLVLSSLDEVKARQEFNAFLIKNGIENQGWLQNLTVIVR